jgi:hypothetical protein
MMYPPNPPQATELNNETKRQNWTSETHIPFQRNRPIHSNQQKWTTKLNLWNNQAKRNNGATQKNNAIIKLTMLPSNRLCNHRNKQLNYTIIKLCYHRSNYLIIEITMLSSNRQCNHRIKQPNETSGQNNGATQKNNAIMELTMLSSKQLFNHRSNYLIIEITMLSSKQLFNHRNNYAIIEAII